MDQKKTVDLVFYDGLGNRHVVGEAEVHPDGTATMRMNDNRLDNFLRPDLAEFSMSFRAVNPAPEKARFAVDVETFYNLRPHTRPIPMIKELPGKHLGMKPTFSIVDEPFEGGFDINRVLDEETPDTVVIKAVLDKGLVDRIIDKYNKED